VVSDQNVTTLRRAFEAFARDDFDAVAATLDPDVVWDGVGELVPGGARHRGVDEVVEQVFESIRDAYDEFCADPEEFIDVGERVIALGTFTVRPEGGERTIRTPFVEVIDFRGGRMARVRWFTDTAEWVYAMPTTPPASQEIERSKSD